MKRSQPKREWSAAREKVVNERVCRNCGALQVETAHILGRTYDRYAPLRADGWRKWTVAPDRVLPLCSDCHRRQHDGRLEILPLLTLEEQLQAVADAGTISRAARLLAPGRLSGEPYRGDFAPLPKEAA